MLAVAWPWSVGAEEISRLAERLATSLCAGIGGHAGTAEVSGVSLAYRPTRSSAIQSRAWRPAILKNGKIVIFHGYFDNAAKLAGELGEDATSDVALLYGNAVEAWGDAADQRVVGEYCSVIADPDHCLLRLSRSPLRAPPLYYYHNANLAATGSTPRTMFAAGVVQQLNEQRVADNALLNFAETEQSWFEHVARVPLGSIVELQPGRDRVLRKFYDLLALPKIRLKTDADYIARASELLDEGVQACLAGFKRPGATLSGGLDSPQVAVRALAALPISQSLPTFTFHPEDGYDGRVQTGMFGDDRPFVEAFTAMHPRLEPHFTDNRGYGHDHRWNDFFHVMGGAPSGLCNMYVFHGLFKGAADEHCDVLLLADWGNETFSDSGDWGFVQYFLSGKWRQLWLALTNRPEREGRLLKRFAARTLSALLPTWMWRRLRRVVFPHDQFLPDLVRPLSPTYRRTSGADRRLVQSGAARERYQPWTRRHATKLQFQNADAETDEIYQAFEQMYGVAQRDPTAYRPFVEFCLGLPIEMFLRDGSPRWLAKQMAKGIMPEKQRTAAEYGRWDSDWHLRIGRRRKDYLAELERIAGDGRIAPMLDLPRLRGALENWPAKTETDPQKFFSLELGVPRALLVARFIKYVEGRNDG